VRRTLPIVALLLVAAALWLAPRATRLQAEERAHAPRFAAVDVFVDAKSASLAAWQVELDAERKGIQIVGVEGGEHAAFAKPPYYDPKALKDDRIVLAAFSTGKDLPSGRTRVARVHLRIEDGGDAAFAVKLLASASMDGKEASATVSVEEHR